MSRPISRPLKADLPHFGRVFLENEAVSLISRLEQVQPFSLSMPMVAAASISDEAFRAVTDHILLSCRTLRGQVADFIRTINHPTVSQRSDAAMQAQFAALKLRFNAILDQFDIFADVICQRAEHRTGVWVAGLDVLASDALQLSQNLYEAPPVICFLERGHGAAIRKARTRLPGGDQNPVAVIQVPRERMVGSGIASSLVHEVGHQGAALLDLVTTIRTDMRQNAPPQYQRAWTLLSLWISEIIADFWAMAHLGIGATLGLISVVSLPRYFMFRIHTDDPHPFPWIRVALSLAFGEALYPHVQWHLMRQLWHRLYPLKGLDTETIAVIQDIQAIIPQFVQLVLQHRNSQTQGQRLVSLFPIHERQPARLQQLFRLWQQKPERVPLSMPSLTFAVIGQARADSTISATTESRLLGNLLTQWAWMRAEDRTTGGGGLMRSPSPQVLREFQKFIQ